MIWTRVGHGLVLRSLKSGGQGAGDFAGKKRWKPAIVSTRKSAAEQFSIGRVTLNVSFHRKYRILCCKLRNGCLKFLKPPTKFWIVSSYLRNLVSPTSNARPISWAETAGWSGLLELAPLCIGVCGNGGGWANFNCSCTPASCSIQRKNVHCSSPDLGHLQTVCNTSAIYWEKIEGQLTLPPLVGTAFLCCTAHRCQSTLAVPWVHDEGLRPGLLDSEPVQGWSVSHLGA